MDKEKITVYYTSEFFGSVQKVEGYLIEHGTRKYAQYDNAPFIKYIPKGKRKGRMIQKTYNPYLLILKGWNNPDTDGMFGSSKTENGVTIKKSKYSSFDDRYKNDFNSIINQYNNLFIADYRKVKN